MNSKNLIEDNILKQIFIIALILTLSGIIMYQLRYFIPGTLGAVMLYILFRDYYLKLTQKYKWKKSLASIFLIILSAFAIILPIWISFETVVPEMKSIIQNPEVILLKFEQAKQFFATKPILNQIDFSDENIQFYIQKISTFIPKFLNSISEVLVNILVAFFILYFMQTNSGYLEQKVRLFIPFSDENIEKLWKETNVMVRSNAIGIPILAFFQGLLAFVGYWIFGVNSALVWGLLTGFASVIPVVGTMLVWVPVCTVQFFSGDTFNAIILTVYCLVVVGGVDNVLRFTLLKKIGNVHPPITFFGVILGIQLFGFIGIIFGPLLIAYALILLNIYLTEFRKHNMLARIQEIQENFPEETGNKNKGDKS